MTRPRGFIDGWRPRDKTVTLVDDVRMIISNNADILPLTIRQIFYMLVSNYGFDKTESAYQRLCGTLNNARRARWIDMDMIRDDGLRRHDPDSWESVEQLVDAFKSSCENFTLNRQAGQPTTLFVWCEAEGMSPQLAGACGDYGVTVLSSGGFDSVTTKHSFAREISDYTGVEILHIGDHDPSGVHMHSSLSEDLQAFVADMGGAVTVTRLAVTPEQVADMGLPTAPPKATDRRAFAGLTTQAEAIPPRTLRQIVKEAIEARLDPDIRQDVLDKENACRGALDAISDSLDGA